MRSYLIKMPESDMTPVMSRVKAHIKHYAFLISAIIGFFALLIYLRGPIVGAVVSNVRGCAHVGARMLSLGGSAVDAAIATLICEGVLMSHCTGLGGGFVGMIYTKSDGRMESIIAREMAPEAATKDLLVGLGENAGALAAGVPGELLGYWEMHQRYGRLPWRDLFHPSISFCRRGHWVSKHYAMALRKIEQQLRKEPSMREVSFNTNGDLYDYGDFIERKNLAHTLERIAKYGPGDFYNGGLTGERFIKDVKEMGGIMTVNDLKKYRVTWHRNETVMTNISNGYTLYTTPLPTSGILLTFILNIMDTLYTDYMPLYYHRMIESFKHAFGQRDYLGDMFMDPEMRSTIEESYNNLTKPQFITHIKSLINDGETFNDKAYYSAKFANSDDYGTANIAVLASNGDAVVITSSLNNYFGAKKLSRRTGIILNDQLNDFSVADTKSMERLPSSSPPSPMNSMKPGKRPFSSMCPTIVLDDKGNVRMLIGGAGGKRIITAVATTILRYLVLNETLKDSMGKDRLHHQLIPMALEAEMNVPIYILQYLAERGHNILKSEIGTNYAALTVIGVDEKGVPEPVCDRRRGGSATLLLRRFRKLSWRKLRQTF